MSIHYVNHNILIFDHSRRYSSKSDRKGKWSCRVVYPAKATLPIHFSGKSGAFYTRKTADWKHPFYEVEVTVDDGKTKEKTTVMIQRRLVFFTRYTDDNILIFGDQPGQYFLPKVKPHNCDWSCEVVYPVSAELPVHFNQHTGRLSFRSSMKNWPHSFYHIRVHTQSLDKDDANQSRDTVTDLLLLQKKTPEIEYVGKRKNNYFPFNSPAIQSLKAASQYDYANWSYATLDTLLPGKMINFDRHTGAFSTIRGGYQFLPQQGAQLNRFSHNYGSRMPRVPMAYVRRTYQLEMAATFLHLNHASATKKANINLVVADHKEVKQQPGQIYYVSNSVLHIPQKEETIFNASIEYYFEASHKAASFDQQKWACHVQYPTNASLPEQLVFNTATGQLTSHAVSKSWDYPFYVLEVSCTFTDTAKKKSKVLKQTLYLREGLPPAPELIYPQYGTGALIDEIRKTTDAVDSKNVDRNTYQTIKQKKQSVLFPPEEGLHLEHVCIDQAGPMAPLPDLPPNYSVWKTEDLPDWYTIDHSTGIITRTGTLPPDFKKARVTVFFKSDQGIIKSSLLIVDPNFWAAYQLFDFVPPTLSSPEYPQMPIGEEVHRAYACVIKKQAPAGYKNIFFSNFDAPHQALIEAELSDFFPPLGKNLNKISILINGLILQAIKRWTSYSNNVNTAKSGYFNDPQRLHAIFFYHLAFCYSAVFKTHYQHLLEKPGLDLNHIKAHYTELLKTTYVNIRLSLQSSLEAKVDWDWLDYHHYCKLMGLGDDKDGVNRLIDDLKAKRLSISEELDNESWIHSVLWWPRNYRRPLPPYPDTFQFLAVDDIRNEIYGALTRDEYSYVTRYHVVRYIDYSHTESYTETVVTPDKLALDYLKHMGYYKDANNGCLSGNTALLFASTGKDEVHTFDSLLQKNPLADLTLRGRSKNHPLLAIDQNLRLDRPLYQINGSQFTFTAAHPFVNVNALSDPEAPYWLCVEPEVLEYILPILKRQGIAKLEAGAKVVARYPNQQDAAIEVKIIEEMTVEGQDTSVYLPLLGLNPEDDYQFYAGDADSIFYELGAEVSPLYVYPYAAVAMLRAILKAQPVITKMAATFWYAIQQAATDKSAEEVLRMTRETFNAAVYQTLKLNSRFHPTMVKQQLSSEDLQQTVDQALEKASAAFMTALQKDELTQQAVNWPLKKTYDCFIGLHVEEIDTELSLGWRVLPEKTDAPQYLAITLGDIHLHGNYPFDTAYFREVHPEPINLNILLSSSKGFNAQRTQGEQLRQGSAFLQHLDQVLYFDEKQLNVALESDQVLLTFCFKAKVKGQTKDFRSRGFLPTQLPAYYRRYQWEVVDSENNLCGAFFFDTRRLNTAQYQREQQLRSQWSTESKMEYALRLGNAWGETLTATLTKTMNSIEKVP